MWRTILILILCIPCELATATDFHVTTNGVAGATGDINHPWTLEYSFTNPVSQGGDNIWVHDGLYGIGTNNLWSVSISGTSSNLPITWRTWPGDHPKLNGGIFFNGNWDRWWGPEVFNSNSNRVSDSTVRPPGLSFFGHGGQVINTYVHDTGQPGIAMWDNNGGDGSVIYGCISANNGINSLDPGWNGALRGDGYYMQNTNGVRWVMDSMAFGNVTIGFKSFTEQAYANGFYFDGCFGFRNGGTEMTVSASHNPITTLWVTNSGFYTYQEQINPILLGIFPILPASLQNNQSLNWNNNIQASDAGSSFNYLNSPWAWSTLSINGNTMVQTSPNVTFESNFAYWDVMPTNVVSYSIDHNTYYANGAAGGFDGWRYNNARNTFAAWKGLGFDNNGSFITTLPATNSIIVRPNKFEPGRAHIVVFNWLSNNTVNVDFTPLSLQPNQYFAVYDVQNLSGPPVYSNQFNAGSPIISLPMTNTAVTPPIGLVTNTFNQDITKHTLLVFNAFLVIPGSSCSRPTVNAASPSFSDVSTAMSSATAGTAVVMPSGTAIWTQTLTIPPGVSLLGAGNSNTVIIDEVSRSSSPHQLIKASGTNYEIGGFVVSRGVTNTTYNWDGEIFMSGFNFRLHHMTFWKPFGLPGYVIARQALFDHNICITPGGEAFQTYDSGFGDDSWANPIVPGSQGFLYFEDNWFQDGNTVPGIDAYNGSQLAIRHNVFTNSWTGNHGTDSSQRQRSTAWMEVYLNTFVFPPGSPNVPWPWTIYYRGGSGVVFSNLFQGRFGGGVALATYRNIVDGSVDGSPNWPPWGPANGTSPWDGNTDSLGYPVLDQVGRGVGDLITGSPPINSTTGTKAWPHQASNPLYVWNNTLQIDTSSEVRVQQASIIQNRDYFLGTPKPGYIPFQYPHPLQSGCFTPAPPPISPKVVVTGNLRVTGNLNIK